MKGSIVINCCFFFFFFFFCLFSIGHVFQSKDKNNVVNEIVRVPEKREFEKRRSKPTSPGPFEEIVNTNTTNNSQPKSSVVGNSKYGGIEFGKVGKDEDDSLWDSQHSSRKDTSQGGSNHVQKGSFVVRLRGLPWQITEEDITGFFSGLKIIPEGIYFFRDSSGRPMGEGFVRFETKYDSEEAIKRHKKFIGKRYIEVFSSSMDEWNKSGADNKSGGKNTGRNSSNSTKSSGSSSSSSSSSRSNMTSSNSRSSPVTSSRKDRNGYSHSSNNNMGGGFVVRMRGLPYSVSIGDILNFFKGIDLEEDQIYILTNHSGQITGDGYVNFNTAKNAERAMAFHNSRIGRRYIELFSSDDKELNNVLSRSGFLRPSSSREHLNRSRDRERMRYSPYRESDRGTSRLPYPTSPYHDNNYRSGGIPQNIPISTSGSGRNSIPSSNSMHVSPIYPPPPPPSSSKNINMIPNESYILRLRGLPYSVTNGDIEDFFSDAEIIRGGVHIIRNQQGKLTGEAYVEFCSDNDKRIALRKHNNRIGSRYIELFHASDEEFERYIGSTSPNLDRRINYSPIHHQQNPVPLSYRSHHIPPEIDPALVRMLQLQNRANYDHPSMNSSHMHFGGGGGSGYSDPYMSQPGPPPRGGYHGYSPTPPPPPPNSMYPPPQHHQTYRPPPQYDQQEEPSVVIRGLTANVTVADIQRYFIGYHFLPDSIRVVSNIERTIFEATVQFATVPEAKRALNEKECGFIGDSFIKLYDR